MHREPRRMSPDQAMLDERADLMIQISVAELSPEGPFQKFSSVVRRAGLLAICLVADHWRRRALVIGIAVASLGSIGGPKSGGKKHAQSDDHNNRYRPPVVHLRTP